MSYGFISKYLDDECVPGRVFDVFMPEKTTRDIALFFVHGGGWRGGTRTCYHPIMRAFNKEGFICASADYRLSGVNIFEQLMDTRHAYLAFCDFLREKQRPVKLFTHGASAGAHLTALLSFARPGACGEPLAYGNIRINSTDWVMPVGTALQSTPVLFCSWDDIFPPIWTAMRDIAGVLYEEKPECYAQIAPFNYISSDSCPVLFIEAENEHMFPHKYIIQFVEKMKKLNRRAEMKVYDNVEHGFFYDVTRRQQKQAFSDICSFIDNL